jgi:hypothetical protein
MKCSKCSRPLTKPALTVPAKTVPLVFGPKCARSMLPPKPKRVRVVKQVAVLVEMDPRQMPLQLEVA